MSDEQEMGETREPMAADCMIDALRIANNYAFVKKDFWICFASKPHVNERNKLIHGWEVVWQRPPVAVPGMLVFHVDIKNQNLTIDSERSLPYDIPLDETLLSTKSGDFIPELATTAKKSGSILLA